MAIRQALHHGGGRDGRLRPLGARLEMKQGGSFRSRFIRPSAGGGHPTQGPGSELRGRRLGAPVRGAIFAQGRRRLCAEAGRGLRLATVKGGGNCWRRRSDAREAWNATVTAAAKKANSHCAQGESTNRDLSCSPPHGTLAGACRKKRPGPSRRQGGGCEGRPGGAGGVAPRPVMDGDGSFGTEDCK